MFDLSWIMLFAAYVHNMLKALEDKYGGWLNTSIVPVFEAYAEACFKEYGSKVRVQEWFYYEKYFLPDWLLCRLLLSLFLYCFILPLCLWFVSKCVIGETEHYLLFYSDGVAAGIEGSKKMFSLGIFTSSSVDYFCIVDRRRCCTTTVTHLLLVRAPPVNQTLATPPAMSHRKCYVLTLIPSIPFACAHCSAE